MDNQTNKKDGFPKQEDLDARTELALRSIFMEILSNFVDTLEKAMIARRQLVNELKSQEAHINSSDRDIDEAIIKILEEDEELRRDLFFSDDSDDDQDNVDQNYPKDPRIDNDNKTRML